MSALDELQKLIQSSKFVSDETKKKLAESKEQSEKKLNDDQFVNDFLGMIRNAKGKK